MNKKPLIGLAAGVLLVGGGSAVVAAQPGSTSTDERESTARSATFGQTATSQPRLAAGDDYVGDVYTTTALSLRPRTVQYGATSQARVSVGAQTADTTPRGSVSVGVDGQWASSRLRNGSATVALPRDLIPWTYRVKADYNPRRGSEYDESSDTAFLRVIRANSRAAVDVPNISRRERPRVATTVTTDTGVQARGIVRVTISKRRADHVKTVRLRDGRAVARFPRVRPGRWAVRVVYTGNQFVQRDGAGAAFRVRRR